MIAQSTYATRADALEAARQAESWPGFVRAIVSATAGSYTLSVALSYPAWED
jgi:hypothetical protein